VEKALFYARPANLDREGETTMYTISDIVEMGEAHELVLSIMKDEFVFDDAWPWSMPAAENFD